MINEAIHTILSTNANLIAAIPAAKMFPINAPQEINAPLLIHDIVRTEPENDKDGYSIEQVYLEVDVYDNNAKTAYTNAALVKAALYRKVSTVNSADINTIIFDGMQAAGFDPERKEYRVSMGFRIRQKI